MQEKKIINLRTNKHLKKYNAKHIHYEDVKKTLIYSDILIRGRPKTQEEINKSIESRRYNIGYTNERNIYRSMSRLKNNVYDLMMTNKSKFDYFITITFDKQKIESRYDFEIVSKKLSKFMNNLKRKEKNIYYIFVPERHQDGAWHFHGLIGNIEKLNIIESTNPHSNEKILYEGNQVYNIIEFEKSLGWNTITKIRDNEKAINYMLQYIKKELIYDLKNKKKIFRSNNLDKAKITYDNITEKEELEIKKIAYAKITYTIKNINLDVDVYKTKLNIT